MITDNLTDDADIQREVRNLFVRTNIQGGPKKTGPLYIFPNI